MNTDYETLKAERDAALNTCSLIADALGITGAVAGDTIARVQQLVAENVPLRSDAREAAETVEAESRGVEKLAKAFKSWADESNGDYEAERHWAVASKEAFSFAADMRFEAEGVSSKVDITCYSCRRFITFQQHAEADGFCPYCNVEIELDDKGGDNG
ncbi:zinc-ribbon domain-containing protein [Yersinia massiliensis]|uniref:zinc-ribbon domain-containing protein n=1 Tax=Yersinia massiliensis TaxID=419257 RepID=UPI001643B4F4|nr:zinc-ribbon domain-containing protein [Yersinia massiliensis]